MTDQEEFRRRIEERVWLVRQKYFLRREIFDLEQDIAYMKKNNLFYINRDLRIGLSVEELEALIENREKRIKKIELEQAKYDRTGKAGNHCGNCKNHFWISVWDGFARMRKARIIRSGRIMKIVVRNGREGNEIRNCH